MASNSYTPVAKSAQKLGGFKMRTDIEPKKKTTKKKIIRKTPEELAKIEAEWAAATLASMSEGETSEVETEAFVSDTEDQTTQELIDDAVNNKLADALKEIILLKEEIVELKKKSTKTKTKTKTKTNTKKFDLYEISQEEELTQILEDHYAPVHGWVQGNLKEEYHGIETIFKTLKEAHDYYLETLKEKLEPSDVRYGGIIKATSGYKLMPNTHWAKSQTYKPHHNIKLKEWVYWKFDETCLE